MNSVEQVLRNVLEQITPTPEEIYVVNEVIDVISTLLKQSASESGVQISTIDPQGSTGIKQTHLRNDFDIDLFIGLDYSSFELKHPGLSKNKKKKEFKKDFLKLCNDWILKSLNLKQFRDLNILYAEHPYVNGRFIDPEKNLDIKIDVVLYFDLPLEYIRKNGPITAVDRSPWHGRFVRDNLSYDQKNDVRLLKQFFKSNYSYGDKSALGKGGFIGYSAELLIYHFKSIIDVFQNFEELYLRPLDYFKRDEKKIKSIYHFQNDPLLIIDPVDKNRNVASAISKRAYKYCCKRISEFLNAPSEDFFLIRPIPEDKNLDTPNYYIVECKNTDSNVHYTINRDKLYSLAESLKKNGEKEYSHESRFGKIEFEIYFESKIGEFNIAIYCEVPTISSTYFRRGPLDQDTSHAIKFKQKNQNYITKDGYLWVESKRQFSEFLSFLTFFVETRIPKSLEIKNITKAINVQAKSAKRALYVLKNYVLPYLDD